MDVRARGRAGVPRDGRLRGAGGARRDGRDRRRRGRRPGRDPAPAADRARLALRRARRHDELLHRPPPRPPLPRASRAAGQDHRGAARAGRALLRPPRRQDDPDRPLHRPGARAGAVHRGLVGAAVPPLHPVQHRRHRAVGDDVLRARLHLLAVVRPGRQARRPGRVRLRRVRRADRRRRGALPAARRDQATGSWRTAAIRSSGRCSRSARRCTGTWSGPWSTLVSAVRVASRATGSRPATSASSSRRCSRSAGWGCSSSSSTSPSSTGRSAPTPFDTELLDLASRLRSDMLVDVAKMVTVARRVPDGRGARRGRDASCS